MRPIRTVVIAMTTVVALVAGTGVAHAVLTEDVLLTESEAQAASGFGQTLTRAAIPAAFPPGVLVRLFKAGEFGLDNFGVFVIDPQGGKGAEPSGGVEGFIEQMKSIGTNMECKIYEQSGTKITTVCWGSDPAMVMGFSSDIKTYFTKKKVNGRWKRVVFKEIPVLGTATHIVTADVDTISEALKDQTAAEAKGLRNAQMAKLPAKY